MASGVFVGEIKDNPKYKYIDMEKSESLGITRINT